MSRLFFAFLSFSRCLIGQETINLKINLKIPPAYFNQANLVTGYKSVNSARVDIFDKSGNKQILIPSNYVGAQISDNDENYFGIITYFEKRVISLKESIEYGQSNLEYCENYSSYIQLEVPAILDSAKEYNVCFKLSLADYSGFSTSGWGVYFTDKRIKEEENTRLKVKPQLSFTGIINNKNDWMELKAKYKPTGKEKFIVLGCFDDNYKVEKVSGGKDYAINKAYYYMSSIKLVEIPKDKDKDGVLDINDKCIDVFGLASLQGCPDKDNDGIKDEEDKCPDIAGLSEFNGCPDTDADGITDANDKCPTVKGSILNNGCPEIKPELNIKENVEIMLANLQFEKGKEVLKNESYKALDNIINILKDNPTLCITLDGIVTNESVDVSKNKLLLDKRANSIKSYLVKKGSRNDVIKVMDYGITKPTNDQKQDNDINRRIEY